MKPYYQDELVTLFCGRCEEILPKLDVKADLCLTDLPYGNDTGYDNYDDSRRNLKALIPIAMKEIISSSRIALITPGVGNMFMYPEPDWVLNWTVPAGNGSGKWGFCCWQPILAYGDDPYLKNGLGRRPDTIIQTESAEINGHPCPKPIGVWKRILQRGSVNEGDLILDPFAGSGTTLVAAKLLKRKSIGIEMSPKYCQIIVDRLNKPIPLFDTPQTELNLRRRRNGD